MRKGFVIKDQNVWCKLQLPPFPVELYFLNFLKTFYLILISWISFHNDPDHRRSSVRYNDNYNYN